MKDFTEAIHEVQFKLLLFGVTIQRGEQTCIFFANGIILDNSSNFESVMNNNHSSITAHEIHWDVAAKLMPFLGLIQPRTYLIC